MLFRSSKTTGLGLGLPIARALARAMRGELSFEGAKDKAFRLELPMEGGRGLVAGGHGKTEPTGPLIRTPP